MSVGKLYCEPCGVNVQWEVSKHTYNNVSSQEDRMLRSPPFSFMGATCNILIYRGKDFVEGWFVMGLLLGDPALCEDVTFTLVVKDTSGESILCDSAVMKSKGFLMCEKIKLCSFERNSRQSEHITIFCGIGFPSGSDVATQTPLDSTPVLCRDFEDLLESGRSSDVTIHVQDRAFKVHKSILEARSPVFAAMVQHDMVEKNNQRRT